MNGVNRRAAIRSLGIDRLLIRRAITPGVGVSTGEKFNE